MAMAIVHPAFVSYRRFKMPCGHVRQFTSLFHSHIYAVCEEQNAQKPFIDLHQIAAGDSLSDRIRRGMISSRFFFCILSPAYFGSKHKWPVRELVFARNIVKFRNECGDRDSKIIYIVSVNEIDHYSFLGDNVVMIDCSQTEAQGEGAKKSYIRRTTTPPIKEAINCSNGSSKFVLSLNDYDPLVFPEADSPEVNDIIERYKEANLTLAQTLPGGL